jgi:cobalt-zinc-cadmium efflux system outer membrane protein
MSGRNAVWYVSVGLLLLAGCNGMPTKDEKAARQQIQTVARDYRPEDRKPVLPTLTTNSTLGDLLKFAMLNQPKVESAYYDWSASIERITTARSRPDPQFTFQMDIENIVSSVMPGFMVNFPGAGKLRAAAAIASAESQAKYFTFETAVLETTYEVKRAYYQLHFLEDRLRVNRATLELLSELEKLALAQNEVGKVTLQDVLRAQIEQNRLQTDVSNLEDTRNSLRAEFKSALGLGPNEADPPLPTSFEPAALDLSSEKLLASAMEHSPRLKAMEAEVRAAEAAIVLANKDRNPDFAIGLMADARMSPVLYRPWATVSLPVWRDKIAAQIAEGQAAKKAAEARLSGEQIAIAVEFADRSVAYREATRNLEVLQQELLPKQRQSLEVARSGYLAGQIDFFNLTDAEQTLLRFALAEVDAREQRELALTELSLLTLGVRPNAPMGSRPPAMNSLSPMKQTAPMPSGTSRKMK